MGATIQADTAAAAPPTGWLYLGIGVFLVGGDFWDKLRALFVRQAKARFPDAKESAP